MWNYVSSSSLQGAISLLLALAVLGCEQSGPTRYPVAGAVLFDGKPMKEGTIRFMPINGTKGPAVAGPIKDGFYDFPREQGGVVGDYRVEIEGQLDLPFEIDDEEAYAKAYASGKKNPLPPQSVPAIYNRNSTLKVTLVADDAANKFDFDLTKGNKATARN